MKRVTFDIETVGDFLGNGDFSNQEITMVGIHDSDDGYSSYTKDELGSLWPILERADVLIGYNSDHFDIPILNRYYTGDLTKIRSLDLLKEIKQVLGRRLKLDNLAEATLGYKKGGSGLDAVRWWKEGKVEKVREYCLHDVKITKELYDYALQNRTLRYRDFDGLRDIKLDTSLWESPTVTAALTHTLPF